MKRICKLRLLVGMAVLFCAPSAAWADDASGWAPTYAPQEPLTVITVLLICAFAIDRIVTGVLALSPPSAGEARSRKVYLILAGILGVLLGVVGNVGVLGNLGFSSNPYLNVPLTALILMGGSDRIGALIARMGGKPALEKPSNEPIEITGKLTLVDERTPQANAPSTGTSSELPKGVAAGTVHHPR